MYSNIFHKISSVVVLIHFILSNSYLFVYQHFCGEELYATVFYHTVSCECNDEVNIHPQDWINYQSNDCCEEKLIFAHIPYNFVHYSFVLKILWILLLLISIVKHIRIFSIVNLLSCSIYPRRRSKNVALMIHYQMLRSVILRN